jgi:DNA-binding IclR family transcriptional regulator
MSRPALAATRSAAILNFLAANPSEAFTLSDLAERLGVNVASMHALLNALTDAGYLTRHPRLRTYTLGPSVIALGTAALETHPEIDLARDAARELARETGLEVAVTTVAGDHIVFVARAGEGSPRAVPVHVGQHVPFAPPLGSVFVAWGDEAQWLARADDAESLRPILTAVRGRGYSIALEAETRKELGHALDDLASVPSDDTLRGAVDRIVTDLGRREYQVIDLDPERAYDVSMIAAPVFGPGGDVALAITLLGFGPELAGSQVARYGERLRDVALVVTRRARGRVPTSASVVHA